MSAKIKGFALVSDTVKTCTQTWQNGGAGDEGKTCTKGGGKDSWWIKRIVEQESQGSFWNSILSQDVNPFTFLGLLCECWSRSKVSEPANHCCYGLMWKYVKTNTLIKLTNTLSFLLRLQQQQLLESVEQKEALKKDLSWCCVSVWNTAETLSRSSVTSFDRDSFFSKSI